VRRRRVGRYTVGDDSVRVVWNPDVRVGDGLFVAAGGQHEALVGDDKSARAPLWLRHGFAVADDVLEVARRVEYLTFVPTHGRRCPSVVAERYITSSTASQSVRFKSEENGLNWDEPASTVWPVYLYSAIGHNRLSDDAHQQTTDRRTYLKATAGLAAASTVGLAGCSGGSGTGTLSTQVTDQPGDIGDFESCIITMAGFWVKSGSGEEGDDSEETETVDESDDREYYEFDEAQEADLVQLQDGNTSLIDERELEAGEYAYLQLDVTGVDATLDDGSDATVDTPGDAPLQFKEPFEIRESERTVFTADFTPVKRGQAGGYILQPVASGTNVEYESESTETETAA